jgi:hypothetical protein
MSGELRNVATFNALLLFTDRAKLVQNSNHLLNDLKLLSDITTCGG